MAANSALLTRIENDQALSRYFEWPCDFDVTRREPVEVLHLSSGAPLVPVAGCGTGGTYFLCGEPAAGATGGAADDERPVIYTDSEGHSGLIAHSLREALELIAGIPYWKDCLHLSRAEQARPEADLLEELESDFLDAVPEFDPEQQRAAVRALGIELPERTVLLRRLREALARTLPDYVVHNAEGWPYDSL
ncbi:hypothetical protein D7294_04355 [Streptomyces hoynatensis]|uniref:Uncharacterized protein n=1 Tax=Streptomyces hoynatensis TaxID=1141874 RepID=A0A3A9ZD12_9ACTN|nr:hypothetical protein D7294_04355 [Streptomyces hoynatensis]